MTDEPLTSTERLCPLHACMRHACVNIHVIVGHQNIIICLPYVQVSAVSSVDVKYGEPLSGAVGGDPTDWRYDSSQRVLAVLLLT